MTAKGNAGSSVCPVPPRIAAQIHRLFICRFELYALFGCASNPPPETGFTQALQIGICERARTPGASAAPVPQPQSAQLAFMARLLVSADLTADEIPATGGHRRFVPAAGDDPLHPLLRKFLNALRQLGSRCCIEKDSKTWRSSASGPAAFGGQPGCEASGESQGIIPRKKRAFSLGFSRLSWARSRQAFVNPSAAGGACSMYSCKPLRQVRVQGDHLPGRGFGGGAPPTAPLQIPICSSRVSRARGNRRAKNKKRPPLHGKSGRPGKVTHGSCCSVLRSAPAACDPWG